MLPRKPLNSAQRPAGPVDLWATQERCPQAPQAQQQQQKRTNDALQTADIFTRYGQAIQCLFTGTSGTSRGNPLESGFGGKPDEICSS